MSQTQPQLVLDRRVRAAWDPATMRQATQILVRILLLLVALVSVLVIIWIVQTPMAPAAIREPSNADITTVLLPVLAAAIGINLFLEMLFSFVERNWRTLVAYFGRGMRWLHNAETEVESARQWLAQVSGEYHRQLAELPSFYSGVVTSDQLGTRSNDPQQTLEEAVSKLKAAKELMDLAEQRMMAAEGNLGRLLDSADYLDSKRTAVTYLCLLFGMMVATASSLQIFAVMGVHLGNPKVDMVLTGLVIGGLVSPVHVLINNFWDILAKLVKK